MKSFSIVTLLLVLSACAGDMGPTGPQGLPGEAGPQGVQGVVGPAGQSFQYFIGHDVIDGAGRGDIGLPADAGTKDKPPLVTCYLGDGSGAWLVIGTDVSAGGATCGIVWAVDSWYAVMLNAPPGWIFRVVAVW